jgi:polysaccharide pyruvyl transferase WcaK-like protein
VTPYNGGNLGDAAIQDSMISNLKSRIPGIRFLGITLNCENFLERHGVDAFPLLASMMPLGDNRGIDLSLRVTGSGGAPHPNNSSIIRRTIRRVPGLVSLVRGLRGWIEAVRREIGHSLAAFRVLRHQDLLLFSGGGQLDEEYGGAWRLPLAYFKWTLLARLARVPCAMASIGAGSIKLPASRRFISIALRMCCYRSFREARSRAIAADLLSCAKCDSIVPDLAFSLPDSELPLASETIRRLARGRSVIALSPMCFAKPGSWPSPNRALYDRYVSEMAQVLATLIRQGHFVVVACSSLGDDESVIPDLLERLEEGVRRTIELNVHFPGVRSWRDFVAILRNTDCLVASRLHGTILGFVTGTPVVAISFDPKVDWVMEDLGQTEYLLHFRDFAAADVLSALSHIRDCKKQVVNGIAKYRQYVLTASNSARQYDHLCNLALQSYQSHN